MVAQFKLLIKEKEMQHICIHTQKGFTLVEVLIATVILAVGLLAVSTMIARSTIQDSRAYYLTKASMIVEEFIEQETNKQYSQTDYNNIANISTTKTIDGIKYNLNCVIQNDIPYDFCKEMTCTVTWNNKGTQGNTSYAYYLCRYSN